MTGISHSLLMGIFFAFPTFPSSYSSPLRLIPPFLFTLPMARPSALPFCSLSPSSGLKGPRSLASLVPHSWSWRIRLPGTVRWVNNPTLGTSCRGDLPRLPYPSPPLSLLLCTRDQYIEHRVELSHDPHKQVPHQPMGAH